MFEHAMGWNQAALVSDPITVKGIGLCLERILGYYGKAGVDVQLIDNYLMLTAQTRDYIYSNFTPKETMYKKGSRPFLEQVVNKCIRPEMSDREKALSLMRRCRDNRDHGLAKPDLFYGGTEEELLKRGAIMCNEIARVYACFCQIAGLPCRLFASHLTGHMMNEVCVDGKWWWVDVMVGLCPVDERDEPASAWNLKMDPTLFDRQPQFVLDDIRVASWRAREEERDPMNQVFALALARDCIFHPREATAMANYFVWDHERYDFPWFLDPADPQRRQRARDGEKENRKAGGWPDYYFDFKTFWGELRMRRS